MHADEVPGSKIFQVLKTYELALGQQVARRLCEEVQLLPVSPSLWYTSVVHLPQQRRTPLPGK